MRTPKKKPAAGGDRFRGIDDLRAKIHHPLTPAETNAQLTIRQGRRRAP
jgi:hypothetical protein